MLLNYSTIFSDVNSADNFWLLSISLLEYHCKPKKSQWRYQPHAAEQNGILMQVYLYGNEKIIKWKYNIFLW